MDIYIDIETLPPPEAHKKVLMEKYLTSLPAPVDPSTIKAPSNYKDKAKIAEWIAKKHNTLVEERNAAVLAAEQKVDEQHRSMALSGDYGQIFCIGIAIDDDDVEVIHDDDEKEMLIRLYQMTSSPMDQKVFVANASFDLSFIFKRCIVHGVRYPYRWPKPIDITGWNKQIFDVLAQWSGRGRTVSQDTLCDILGIERAPDSITGAEVYDTYLNGDYDTIIQHCRSDVMDLRNIARRLKASDGLPMRGSSALVVDYQGDEKIDMDTKHYTSVRRPK